MNKTIIILIIVVVAGGAVFLIRGGVAEREAGPEENTAGSNQGQEGEVLEEGTNNSGEAEESEVSIEGFSFIPSDITVKKGATVTWTNMDSAGHTVTSDTGEEMDSALLSKGESYPHKFDTAGTFEYHCAPHPFMKGKVIVE